MQWLMAHMWTALAATGVLGLLFGWAVRGLGLRGKLRRAEGERNIAVGTLQEKETELEALYAAGRTPASAEGIAANDDELRKELQEREVKLQTLSDELARSKAELNELRESGGGSGTVETVSAAAVGAAVASVASSIGDDGDTKRLDANIDPEEASLEWRNRYLESQVRSLQDKVQELNGGSEVGTPEVAIATDESAADNVDTAKLKWQNDYLRQRLQFLETSERPPVSSTLAPEAVAVSTPVAEMAEADTTPSVSDEEIAKLRWRNRYLEGRLAYYEGDKEEGEDGPEDSGIASLAAGAAVAATELADQVVATDPAEEMVEAAAESASEVDFESIDLDSDGSLAESDAPEVALEVADDAEPIAETEADTSSDAIGERPLALEGPVGGEGDDLTAIGGIGPKIEEVLNELGIYHFDQIAAWSKDNIDWVDEYLAFKGRIEREQWVEQAASLSGDNVT